MNMQDHLHNMASEVTKRAIENDLIERERHTTLILPDMTIGALVGARQRLKSQLEVEEAEYEKRIAPMKTAMQKVEGAIVDKLDAEKLDNVKTPYGTAYFTNPESMKVVDRSAFFKYVVDNEAYDVLTSAVSKDAIRARGEIPPGVEVKTIRVLRIRKT